MVADAVRFSYVESQDFPANSTIPAWWQDFYFGAATEPTADPDQDGYTTAQDISDRTIQNSESQWARAKSFDTFTPLGPYVETKIDPHDLNIQLFQNGQLRQNSNTSQLIFDCYRLVSFISTNLTLLPGDIILTGTPSGVGPIESGDRLEVRIQGLSPLVNTVK